MSLLNFPSDPYIGQQHTVGTTVYEWDGVAWNIVPNTTPEFTEVTSEVIIVTSSTNSTSTDSGALQVVGGIGIGGNGYFGGNLYSSGSLVLTTTTLVNSIVAGDDIRIDLNTETGVLTIVNTSTFQTVTSRGSTTSNILYLTNEVDSTSTDTGALQVSGGIAIAKNLYSDGNFAFNGTLSNYIAGSLIPTTSNVNLGTLESPFNTLYLAGQTLYIGSIKISEADPGTISIGENNTGSIQVGTIGITSLENSTSTTTGALIVAGGVGIGADVWVEGRINSESLKIADSVFDSTLVNINTTGTVVIDIYSIENFRSAKYLIQIDEGTGTEADFQVIEILLLADNNGTVYATEYALVTSNGEMGEFSADIQMDNNVRLYFTPFYETEKIIKVLRTGMSA
jgi:hypothetical protein